MISSTANKLSRHLCPVGIQKPSELQRAPSPAHVSEPGGNGAQAGRCLHRWSNALNAAVWRPQCPPSDSHAARLFALCNKHLSFWFCVLFKILWEQLHPGAPLSHSHILLSLCSPAAYEFLKIRNFNGSADSAWTLLYQHRVHWKDEIKGPYKLQLCVPDDFL